MGSFRGWVHEEVQRQFKRILPKQAHEVIDETFTVIRHRAEQRAVSVIVKSLDAKAQYIHEPEFHTAVVAMCRLAVAGIFGDEQEQLFPYEKSLLKALFDTSVFKVHESKDGFPGDKAFWSAANQVGPKQGVLSSGNVGHYGGAVTEKALVEAVKEMKKGLQPAYGKVVMGRNAGKSGLPAAQEDQKAEEAALTALLAKVEQKSDELLGIKQKAKYEELVGIDPEEI